jgi:hypothetical protein
MLCLCVAATSAWCDRISEMPRTERCVYEAKLAVAGFYYFLQGRQRAEVKIHWHGDETANEIEFVNRVLDQAYDRAAGWKEAKPGSEIVFGDRTYEACMARQAL